MLGPSSHHFPYSLRSRSGSGVAGAFFLNSALPYPGPVPETEGCRAYKRAPMKSAGFTLYSTSNVRGRGPNLPRLDDDSSRGVFKTPSSAYPSSHEFQQAQEFMGCHFGGFGDYQPKPRLDTRI